MEIAAERVVSFHYTLTDDAGAVIDRSPDDRPLSYLHGAGNIVPGLENALAGQTIKQPTRSQRNNESRMRISTQLNPANFPWQNAF